MKSTQTQFPFHKLLSSSSSLSLIKSPPFRDMKQPDHQGDPRRYWLQTVIVIITQVDDLEGLGHPDRFTGLLVISHLTLQTHPKDRSRGLSVYLGGKQAGKAAGNIGGRGECRSEKEWGGQTICPLPTHITDSNSTSTDSAVRCRWIPCKTKAQACRWPWGASTKPSPRTHRPQHMSESAFPNRKEPPRSVPGTLLMAASIPLSDFSLSRPPGIRNSTQQTRSQRCCLTTLSCLGLTAPDHASVYFWRR